MFQGVYFRLQLSLGPLCRHAMTIIRPSPPLPVDARGHRTLANPPPHLLLIPLGEGVE